MGICLLVDPILGMGWKRKKLLKKDVVFRLITLLLKQTGKFGKLESCHI